MRWEEKAVKTAVLPTQPTPAGMKTRQRICKRNVHMSVNIIFATPGICSIKEKLSCFLIYFLMQRCEQARVSSPWCSDTMIAGRVPTPTTRRPGRVRAGTADAAWPASTEVRIYAEYAKRLEASHLFTTLYHIKLFLHSAINLY